MNNIKYTIILIPSKKGVWRVGVEAFNAKICTERLKIQRTAAFIDFDSHITSVLMHCGKLNNNNNRLHTGKYTTLFL